jgi:tetratricopeptide (TPR) repeat protein
MNPIKKAVNLVLISLFISSAAIAQQIEVPKKYDRSLGKANALYSSFVYVKAIEEYKRSIKISDHDLDFPSLRIADSYRLINNNKEALKWYQKVEGKPIMTKQDLANYAQVLILHGDYKKAKEIANEIGTSLERIDQADKSSEIKIDTAAYFMENLVVNSDRADFSATYYKDGVVFVSAREISKILPQNKYYWDESFYLDLYYTQNADSTEDYFSSFSSRINTMYHEGPAVFYADDKKILKFYPNQINGQNRLNCPSIVTNILSDTQQSQVIKTVCILHLTCLGAWVKRIFSFQISEMVNGQFLRT